MTDSHPKKELGQHWLHDEATLLRIVDAGEVNEEDTVLEVGPGLGTLTAPLAERAQSVVAVEYDSELAAQLPSRIAAENVSVVEADILDFDLSSLPAGYKVIANIPYYLTSHLIRRLLEAENQPSSIVLLIQKEVAERIVAAPGQLSLLGVSAQHYAKCELDIEVPAELFTPPPKVDSQVVVLKPKQRPKIDEPAFFKLVKAGFGEKRKKLANSLSGRTELEKSEVVQILSELGLNENTRAQELSVEQWYDVFEKVQDVRRS